MFGGELDHLSEDQDEDESKDSGDGSIAPLPASPAARASTAASVSSLNGNVDDEEDEKYNTPVARMSQATVLLFDPRSKHRHELRNDMDSMVKKVHSHGELDEILHTIDKHNTSTDRRQKPIDLVIALLDLNSCKLLEKLCERANDRTLRKLRMLPVFLTMDREMQHCSDLLGKCQQLKAPLAGRVYEDELADTAQLVEMCGRALLKYDLVEMAYKELATEEKDKYPRFKLQGQPDDDTVSDDSEDASDDEEAEEGGAAAKERERRKRAKEFLAKKQQRMKEMKLMQLQQGSPVASKGGGRNSIARSTQLQASGKASGGAALGLIDPRYRPTIYKKKPSSGEAATLALDPSMQPFINRNRPELGSPRTAAGLSRSNTDRVHRLLEAKKHAAAISKKDRPAAPVVSAPADEAKKPGPKLSLAVITSPPAPDLAKQSHLAKFLLHAPEDQRVAEGDGDEQDKAKARTSKLLKAGRIVHHQVSLKMNKAAGFAAGVTDVALAALASKKIKEGMNEITNSHARDVLQHDLIVKRPPFIVSSAAAHFLKRGFDAIDQANFDTALDCFQKAVAREPSALNYGARALAYAKLGMWLKAVRDFSTALGPKMAVVDPDDARALRFNRAVAFTMVGDDSSALADFNQLLKNSDGKPHPSEQRKMRQQVAMLNRRVGSWRKAREEYIGLWTEEERQAEEISTQERDELKGRERRRRQRAVDEAKMLGIELREEEEGSEEAAGEYGAEDGEDEEGGDKGARGSSGGGEQEDEGEFHPPSLPYASRPTARQAVSSWRSVRVGGGAGIDGMSESNHLSLGIFRSLVGDKGDVWESIFQQPSDLQKALVTPPGSRGKKDLAALQNLLKTIPIFRAFDGETMSALCNRVEYRTLKAKQTAYVQTDEMDGFCVLLSGRMVATIKNSEGRVVEIGSLEPFDDFGGFNLLQKDPTDRASLETYRADCPSELLLLTKPDFDKFLKDSFYAEWRERYRLLRCSGIFDGWGVEDVAHVARLCRKKVYQPREVLVEQSKEVDYLFFLTKGIVAVRKYADIYAQTKREIAACDKEIERIKTKYCFHHLLLADAKNKVSEDGEVIMTAAELSRMELETERAHLMQRLRKLESGVPAADVSKTIDVARIMPPGIFGEVSVTIPDKGTAVGSVECDTIVEVLMLHKVALQTFKVSSDFVERVGRKGVRGKYPSDDDVVRQLRLIDLEKKSQQRVLREITSGARKLV